MFGRLRDTIKTFNGEHYQLAWRKNVQVFKLKYPQAEVWSHHLDTNETPGVFIVWRRQSSQYVVDLYASAPQAQNRIDFWNGINQRTSFPERLADVVYRGDEDCGMLNWGRVDYECRAGVGEFCLGKYGRNDTFVRNFVLPEDQHLFAPPAR